MKPKFQQKKVQNPSFPIHTLKLSKDLEEISQQDANCGIWHLPYLKTHTPTSTYCLPSDSDISDSDNSNAPIKTNLFEMNFLSSVFLTLLQGIEYVIYLLMYY